MSSGDSSDLDVPDMSGVYHGIRVRAEVLAGVARRLETIQFDPRLVDPGALRRAHAIGCAAAQRHRARAGDIRRSTRFRMAWSSSWKLYMRQAQALEAVGLLEQDPHADSWPLPDTALLIARVIESSERAKQRDESVGCRSHGRPL